MLKNTDPELHALIEEERIRQLNSIELIASENFTSPMVLECLGSCLTNKYSEGQVGARYYGGNQVIDKIEYLCLKRGLETFGLNADEWGLNVQSYSGSIANLAVYNGLLKPHDRLMGLGLPSGRHLTHGYYTNKKKISVSSIYYESLPYEVNDDGYINYDELEKNANAFKPKLIICGGSAYPRDLDYKKFRQIADKVGAYLMCDMAHFSGLVATGECNNPFEYCDIVTSTTHKTLRGPRSGMIFYRLEHKENINFSVFPSIQGGPHDHQIGALCGQFKEVMTDEFKEYIRQVKRNARILGETLVGYGYKLSSGGTDTHLILMNVRDAGVTGSKMEKLCEYVDISLNKNAIHGDQSAMNPGGIRIGSPWMTTRGCKEEEFKKIGWFLHRCIEISLKIQKDKGKMLKEFVKGFDECDELGVLKEDIKEFMNELNKKSLDII